MIVRKNAKGEWERIIGDQVIERIFATKTVTENFSDGRQIVLEGVACDPYPVGFGVNIERAEDHFRAGTWTQADLDLYDFRIVEPFMAPKDMQPVGTPRYVEGKDGVVSEVYDVEDIPPPPPPETVEQRKARLLADYGLTAEDFAPKVEAKPA